MPILNIPPKLLVIALSGRMLAQMAVDAGYTPLVIDCYADSDTRQQALETIKVASLGLADIRAAVEFMRYTHQLTHVVYGSGFEDCMESLAYLEQDWAVLGNTLTVFRRIQDKRTFFRQLDRFSIPYPESVFNEPPSGGDWLLKPMQGQGGGFIGCYDANLGVKLENGYWQRRLQGLAMSVTFAASYGRVWVLGFNRQWTVAIDNKQAFVFAGVASLAEVSIENQKLLCGWLVKLVGVYGLQGLGSLDFMLVDGCCYVLEINARIPASAQLYGKQVFELHVNACMGVLDDSTVLDSSPCGYEVIYAQKDCVIPQAIFWPDWVLDRPYSGAIFGKGQAICSIIASGKNHRLLSGQLYQRRQFIENILNI